MSIFAHRIRVLSHEPVRIAQQYFLGNIVGEFRAQKTLVRSVLEQTANEIRHSRQQLADRTIFANAISHFNKRPLDRTGHAIEQLKFEAGAIDPEFVGERLRMRDAADVVRAKRGRDDRLVFKQQLAERFKVRVALWLLQINGNVPAVLG